MTKTDKQKMIHQVFDLFLVIIVVAYIVPAAKDALFPTQMTRLEKMLRNSSMQGYKLAIDRKSASEIVLTAFDGDKSITGQIYRDVLRELEPVGDRRVFFTHAINDNAEQVVYLSRVLMETDADLKKLQRLEVTVCGRIRNQTGNVHYDGHEPIYECEVPVRKIIASAVE
jgi:hypothetical protein